jgi:hypothetical protein
MTGNNGIFVDISIRGHHGGSANQDKAQEIQERIQTRYQCSVI